MVLGCCALLPGGVTACGGERRSGRTTGGQAKRGGELRVLMGQAFDTIDPGASAYASVNILQASIHRGLYMFVGDSPKLVPDAAVGDPVISADGKTVTVKIRPGIHFAPPVKREVIASDYRYGITRQLFPSVHSAIGPSIFGGIVGAPDVIAGTSRTLSGISIPDDHTLVIHLAKPTAGGLLPNFIPPFVTPVPPEYARRYDAGKTSRYGKHQVATGPYRFEAAPDGTVTRRGYSFGTRAHLVRNPAWDPKTDRRPAYLDEIDVRATKNEIVAAKQAVRGSHTVAVGMLAPPSVLRTIPASKRPEVTHPNTSDGLVYLTLNTSRPPFDDPELRAAVSATIDRDAVLKSTGGPLLGQVATHLIPPFVTGFKESGGAAGFGPDAAPSSTQTSNARITLVVPDLFKRSGVVVQQQLESLGLHVTEQPIAAATLVARCGDPKIEACISGWVNGPDPESFYTLTLLSSTAGTTPTFNFSHLRSPAVDAATEKAQMAVGPARAEGFAEANRLAMHEAAVIPLVWPHNLIMHSPDVNAFGGSDVDYAYTSLR